MADTESLPGGCPSTTPSGTVSPATNVVDMPESPIAVISSRAAYKGLAPGAADCCVLEWSIEECSARRRRWQKPTKILSNLAGTTGSREMTAIIGPSGCGKTTFLECLSLRCPTWKGAIHLNGKPVTRKYFTQLAYVHQREQFMVHLTVQEHLEFHAITRNARYKSKEDCLALVQAVMAETGLTKCADTFIGGDSRPSVKGISGGERKRLAIATELLSSPPIMFLDEPTSGLDSVMGDMICLLLRTMATQRNRVIMATVHSPSTKTWGYFSHVLVFGAGGQVVFHGPKEAAEIFFTSHGFEHPSSLNSAEFYLEVVSSVRLDESTGALLPCSDYATLAKAFKEKTEGKLPQLPADSSHRKITPLYGQGSSLLTQFKYNMWRTWMDVMRDIIVIIILSIGSLWLGFVMGVLYYNNVQHSWRNAMCMVFTLLVTLQTITVGHVAMQLPGDWSVFIREYYAGANSLLPYFVARSIADVPRMLALSTMMWLPYFLTGYGELNVHFIRYIGVTMIFILGAMSVGYLGSSVHHNPAIGVIVSTLIGTPMVLFSGFLFERNAVPSYFRWIQDTSVTNHAFYALMADHCSVNPNTPLCKLVTMFLQIDPFKYENAVLSLVALVVGFRVLAYLILTLRMSRIFK